MKKTIPVILVLITPIALGQTTFTYEQTDAIKSAEVTGSDNFRVSEENSEDYLKQLNVKTSNFTEAIITLKSQFVNDRQVVLADQEGWTLKSIEKNSSKFYISEEGRYDIVEQKTLVKGYNPETGFCDNFTKVPDFFQEVNTCPNNERNLGFNPRTGECREFAEIPEDFDSVQVCPDNYNVKGINPETGACKTFDKLPENYSLVGKCPAEDGETSSDEGKPENRNRTVSKKQKTKFYQGKGLKTLLVTLGIIIFLAVMGFLYYNKKKKEKIAEQKLKDIGEN